ncbi:hypothetical protein JX266_013250 [Neoarthrinium moseri]|nr:hypothetical protein JX266_013250 [Neoarthrinium moseri]
MSAYHSAGQDGRFVDQETPKPHLSAQSTPVPVTSPSHLHDGHQLPPAYRTSRSSLSVLAAWKWDFVALVTALGLFAAMMALLIRQNNRAVDDWSFFLNLNSTIALPSTIYRAVMVAIAANVVAQSKWVAFWSAPAAMPLLHLQYLNSASHSVWGAVRALPIAARRSVPALVGALVIVVSFAVGPFTQQSLGTATRESNLSGGTASLPIARAVDGNNTYYRDLGGSGGFGMFTFKSDVRARLLTALANPSSNDSAIVPRCTSGNCTFPSWETGAEYHPDSEVTHATAGMCSACADVGSLVTKAHGNSSVPGPDVWMLPNGVNVTAFDRANWLTVQPTRNLSWAQPVIPEDQAAAFRWAFVNVTVLTLAYSTWPPGAEEHRPSRPVAVACSLYPCVRAYAGAVSNGRLVETLLHEVPMYPDVGNYTGTDLTDENSPYVGVAGNVPGSEAHLAAVQSPCLVNGSVYDAGNFSTAGAGATTDVRVLSPDAAAAGYPGGRVPPQCVFRFNTFFAHMVSGFLSSRVLTGTCSWDTRQGESITCDDAYWLAQFWELSRATPASVTGRMAAFAEATTRQFRLGLGLSADAPEGEGEGQQQQAVLGMVNRVDGVALRTAPFVIIDWRWMIFPIALLALEMLVLVWVVVRSLRHRNEEMVWKGNLLPLLYYKDRFVDGDGASSLGVPSGPTSSAHRGPLMTASEMEKDAAGVHVRLLRGDCGNNEYAGIPLRNLENPDQDSLLRN